MSFLDRLEKIKKRKEEEKNKAELWEQIKKERESEWQKDLIWLEKEKEKEFENLVADFRQKKEEEYQKKADFQKKLEEEILKLEESFQKILATQKQNEKELEELSQRIQTETDDSILNLARQRLSILKKELKIGEQELKRISSLKEEKEKSFQDLSNLKIKLEKEIEDYIQNLKKKKEAELEALKEKIRKSQEIEASILLKQKEEAKRKEELTFQTALTKPAISEAKNQGIKKIASLWEKVTGKKLIPEVTQPAPIAPGLGGLAELKVDFFKGESKIIIYASAPGVRPEDVDISFNEENDILTIKGLAKRPEREKNEGKFIFQECYWGPFFRQINLTTEINVYGIRAKLENGVLILELPILKPGEERRAVRKIEIEG